VPVRIQHCERDNRTVPNHLPEGLASILARMVVEVIEADQKLVIWALAAGETPVERCPCRVKVGDLACVCNVEPAVPRAFMLRAAARLERGRFVGGPPRRRCLLCLQGDHDLVETIPVRLVGPDGTPAGSMRAPGIRRRSKRQDRERAERAHAFPAGTRDLQMQAAGIVRGDRR
jgi:hypothetical protein